MSYKFNPFTGNFDLAGLSQSGGALSGDLIFPTGGFVMTDLDGVRWRVTISTAGVLQITVISSGAGSPIGLLLSLTSAA